MDFLIRSTLNSPTVRTSLFSAAVESTIFARLSKKETVESGGRQEHDSSIGAHRNCLNSTLICSICFDSKSLLLSAESEL